MKQGQRVQLEEKLKTEAEMKEWLEQSFWIPTLEWKWKEKRPSKQLESVEGSMMALETSEQKEEVKEEEELEL